jgi:FAS-associated factor 2
VRLPSGERKERRFINTTKVQALYDYIESLNSFEADRFLLISNFPRVVYGPDKLDLTLKDAGLHPRTSLFVQVQEP